MGNVPMDHLLGIAVFGKIGAGVFALGLFWSIKEPLFDKIAREHRKKYGSMDPKEGWICRSCGKENGPLFTECDRCGHKRHHQDLK